MQTTMTKTELVTALRANGAEVAARLRAIPAQTYEIGRYENGWNGRQILAHLASAERLAPRLLDLARAGATPESAAVVDAFDVNLYNQRQVDKRTAAGVADLIAEFELNRATLVTALEAAEEDLLLAHVRSVGDHEGPLAQVLVENTIEHALEHLAIIAGA